MAAGWARPENGPFAPILRQSGPVRKGVVAALIEQLEELQVSSAFLVDDCRQETSAAKQPRRARRLRRAHFVSRKLSPILSKVGAYFASFSGRVVSVTT